MPRKSDDGGINKNITPPYFLRQRQSFQTATTTQCYISLTTCKSTTCHINIHPIESQTLTLVNSNRPRQTDRKLDVCTKFFFFNLLFFFIIVVAHITPLLALYIKIFTVIGGDVKVFPLYVNAINHTQRTIHPAFIFVILHKDNLCTNLEFELFRCGHH